MAQASSLQHVIPEISIQDYQSREKDDVHSLSNVIEASFSQKVKIKLMALGYDEDELDEVTNEVLYEGVEIYENSDDQSQDILELNALEEIHSGLLDRAVLIVYLCRALPTAKVATELQNEVVCELYPDMQQDPALNPTHTVQVPSFSDMKLAVHEFITTTAKQAKKMVLVFNGGKCQKSKEQQVEVESLYKGLKEILEMHRSTQESGSVMLPQAVDVVLVEKNAIEVISEDSNGPTKSIVKHFHPFAAKGFEVEHLNGDMQRVLQLGEEENGGSGSNFMTETWFPIEVQSLAMET